MKSTIFRLFPPILVAFIFLTVQACRSEQNQKALPYIVVEGNTMGTYYRVTYADTLNRDFGHKIDQLLKEINAEISTYIDTSTISRFNRAPEFLDLGIRYDGKAPVTENRHFWACYWKGLEMFQKSGGAFDPTIMPLVNYWGFGYTGHRAVTKVDSASIDSLKNLVGFEKVWLEKGEKTLLRKSNPGVQLDFSALGQGYGVDAIAEFLEGWDIPNFLVDIGGEQRGKGVNPRGLPWRIGISVPKPDAPKEEILTSFPLENFSVNTSGNYRNYHDVDGAKYGHTINPKTGFPERNTLLSATIFARACLHADALATTCMVLGPEKGMALIKQLPEVEAFFIIGTADGKMETQYTSGLKKYLSNIQ
jgi:thiamine biosynthesis lipoprotein